MKNIIILFGPPGIGKGTIGKILAERLKMPLISTGDLLRDNVKRSTPIGNKAEEFMRKGELVPDSIVFEALSERVKQDDASRGFIMDGFPRNLSQAEMFDRVIDEDSNIVLLNLIAQDSVLIERLSLRRICKNCGAIYHLKNIPPKKNGVCDICGGELIQRDDDKPEVISRRLEVFRNETSPLVNYYQGKHRVYTICVEDNLDNIVNRIEGLKLWE
ncbi:MAG TPA: nucleoside monophosphate kinase [Candidatus Ratteibacteria bacterium]|nr:nucleoside monophosphate kinase [bacterium]HRS06156.1 nucleoside monophosphate kinase [Candidatus Ratteibacteria bacterium]HRV03697.1 nucleoside monophosphate kinase [Candidatus Ratteibacteria bacterium]